MANIFLTPTAEFKPFSYAEMIAPIAAYQEAYDKYDDQLNTLAEDAATKAFNFAAQDTKEKAQYDALMNRLKASADSLLTNGLNADIMREIRSINKDYRTSMIPLHQKIAKRAELAEAQRTALQSNPDLRFTIDYSKANLDDIHAGSTYGIINLKDIETKAATDFFNRTSAMPRESSTPIGSSGYYNIETGFGYKPEEFDAAFTPNATTGEIDTTNPIYQFYAQKAAEIDARTDISDALKLEMKEAVKRGMRAGAGKFTSTIKSNNSSGGGGGGTTRTRLSVSADGTKETWLIGSQMKEYNKTTGLWRNIGSSYSDDEDDDSSSPNSQGSSNTNTTYRTTTIDDIFSVGSSRFTLSKSKAKKLKKEVIDPLFAPYLKKTTYLTNSGQNTAVGHTVLFSKLQQDAANSGNRNYMEFVNIIKENYIPDGLENAYEIIYDPETGSIGVNYLSTVKNTNRGSSTSNQDSSDANQDSNDASSDSSGDGDGNAGQDGNHDAY